MEPSTLGTKYDKIARWWYDQHIESSYGVSQFEKAIGYAPKGGKALDVGCGVGGRFVNILQNHGFSVTGLDVSKEMVKLANNNHPEHKFIHLATPRENIQVNGEKILFTTAQLVLTKT